MYYLQSLAMAAAAVTTFSSAACALDTSANTNMVVYWGQGPNQERLSHYCEDSAIDIIPLAFLNVFPDQLNGGYPGTNFGNQCGAETYKNLDQSASPLLSNCPTIGPDIKTCQAAGKKILLSLGGGVPTNQSIKDDASAVKFANFLWDAFGPKRDSYKGPRPFGDAVVDGFDFDIETVLTAREDPADLSRGYGTLINTLRALYANESSKIYYISGAPQCVVPDAHLAPAIESSWFDFVFVQFYNTPQCSARAFFNHTYGAYGGPPTDISFDAWASFLASSSFHPDVKLYLGLPAAPTAAYDPVMYLNPSEAKTIIEHFQARHPNAFGGVMLFEATRSETNSIDGKPYADVLKKLLLDSDFARKPGAQTTTVALKSITPYGHPTTYLRSSSTASPYLSIHGERNASTKPYVGLTGSSSATLSLYASEIGPIPYFTSTAGIPHPSNTGFQPYSTGTGSFPYSSEAVLQPYSSGTGPRPYSAATGQAPYYSSGAVPYPSGKPVSYASSGPVPYASSRPVPYASGKPVSYALSATVPHAPGKYYPYPSGGPVPYASGKPVPYASSGPVPYSSSGPVPYASGKSVPYASSGTGPYASGKHFPYASSSPVPYASGKPRVYEYSSSVTPKVYISATSSIPRGYGSATSSTPGIYESATSPAPKIYGSATSSPAELNLPTTSFVLAVYEFATSSTYETSKSAISSTLAYRNSTSYQYGSTGLPLINPLATSSQSPTTQEVVTIVLTSSYVTTCPATKTLTLSGIRAIHTTLSVSTVYVTYTSTICTKCIAPSTRVSVKPTASSSPAVTTDIITTVVVHTSYTTSPVTKTVTYGTKEAVQVSQTVSTIYETVTSTICTKCVVPQQSTAPTAPNHVITTQEAVTTEIVHTTFTTCPVTQTVKSGTKEIVQVSQTVSTIYETKISTICTKCVAPPTPTLSAPALPTTAQEVVTTVIVSTSVTIYPVIKTVTIGISSRLEVTQSVSTIYQTITSTICTKCTGPPNTTPGAPLAETSRSHAAPVSPAVIQTSILAGNPHAPDTTSIPTVNLYRSTTIVGTITKTLLPVPEYTPSVASRPIVSLYSSVPLSNVPYPASSNGTAPGSTGTSVSGGAPAGTISVTPVAYTGSANKMAMGLMSSVILASIMTALFT